MTAIVRNPVPVWDRQDPQDRDRAQAMLDSPDMTRPVTFAVLDNDALALRMIQRLFQGERRFRLLWTSKLPANAIQLCIEPRNRPEVLLVDMALDGITGCDVCRQINALGLGVACIGITAYSPAAYEQDARWVGIGTILRKDAFSAIPQAVWDSARSPQTGKPSAASTVSNQPDDPTSAAAYGASSPARNSGLSPRELETMRFYAEGKETWEIMKLLHVSKSTLWSYEKRAITKLNAANRTQAVAICVRLHLFDGIQE